MMFISFYKTPEVASEPAHNWPLNQYLYSRQGRDDGGTFFNPVYIGVCVCECVPKLGS